MEEKMKVDKEFTISRPLKKIVFKIPVTGIKWRCCISNEEFTDTFIEVHVRPYRDYTIEFIRLMRYVVELFKKKVESSECTIAEEIAVFIKNGLEEEYPLHEFTVKLTFLEKDRETGLVAVVEVIA